MQHLFHIITSLDMIRLYLTSKDKDKINIPGTPPSLEQAKGMPLPMEISLHVLVLVDHIVLGKALPRQRFSSLNGCFSLQDPALSSQTHAKELKFILIVLILQIIDLPLELNHFFLKYGQA